MRVVVFGASGVQGAHQVPVLARAGHDVVAVSRSPKPLKVDSKHTETTAADFNNRSGISKILTGTDTIFLNPASTSFNPSAPILSAALSIGKLAKNAGVKLIVFNTSMPIPEEPQDIVAQDNRREMRRWLRESGVPIISMQPIVYLDNLLEGWALPPIRDKNTVVYCHVPDLEVSWICHYDVAQLMLAASQRLELDGRDFAVGGPETVRLSQLTGKLSKAWGRGLEFRIQTVEDFYEKIGAAMQGRGLETERIVSQMFKAYTYYNEAEDRPFKIDMGPVLKELPVVLTRIGEWAERRSPATWGIENEGFV